MNNLNLELGEHVKIKYRSYHQRETKSEVIKGKIIFKNDYYITVKTKNYNTSVNLFDLFIGSAVLLPLKGR